MDGPEVSIARALETLPSRADRKEVAKQLLALASELRCNAGIAVIEADYFAIETGDKKLKNALGVLDRGITFYTTDAYLRQLLRQHGLVPESAPFPYESIHSEFRWRIPHVEANTIQEFRPLFLAMVHDSVAYVHAAGL